MRQQQAGETAVAGGNPEGARAPQEPKPPKCQQRLLGKSEAEEMDSVASLGFELKSLQHPELWTKETLSNILHAKYLLTSFGVIF